ncbi:MAG: PEP-CTERM sorting domain-containing protein [Planctomycetales bacterium]|nr:PEP-CTERM sorting domain-containing protein [Planctomycetales bacterium]
MALKKLYCVAALAALVASPVMAAPDLRVADGGLGGSGRIFNVYVTPETPNHSLAVELAFDFTTSSNTSIVSATSTADWEDDGVAPIGNPGANPFTATTTTGIQIAGDTVFASLGSTNQLSAETLVLSIEIDDPIAILELGNITPSIVAENGVLNASFTGTFGIFGDFDVDGDVDITDFGDFGIGFNNGVYDIVDFGDFGMNFGLDIANNALSAGSVATPEPAGLLLIGVALAGVAGARRRNG